MRTKTRGMFVSLMVLYVVAQFVMPKIGLSVAPNFDASCYSGAISFLERVNTGNASCGTGNPGFVGFPFVINFDYNNGLQKLVSLALDIVPPALLAIWFMQRRRRKGRGTHE